MQFETTMWQTGNNTGIEVPAEVVEALGGGRRAPVVVIVNGYRYRSTLAVMGSRHLIPFSSDKRAATGISGGDPISVELELDTEPRTVEPPEDLAAALDSTPGAREAFDRLAPSHRKAHVTAIVDAKTPETRARRIAKAVEKLVSG
ncbi:YdeI/OmpD-associated family protein [Agromyces sp. SYSU T00266]|uniref:YdeI/OmpD-associated family protein n=1 Tax=Agromyces zhanjiangensis TaxID=3158562 RepID=UPI0033981DAA